MESDPVTTPTQIDLERISAHLSLSQETIKLVQDLISQYKQKCGPMHSIKIPYSIICAVLTAWKCQTISSIEEEKDLSQNLSVMDLIKCLNTITNDTFDLELFITELKQFINTVPLPHEIISKLKTIVNKFAFSYTFFVKYHTLFTKLDAQNALSEHGGYVAALKNFGWLLFINAKSEILKNEMDVVKAVFLLMSTLTHVVYNTPSHVTISHFEKLGKNIYDNDFQKKNQKAVQEAIIELLPIMKESKEELTTYNQKLESFIHKANEQNILHFDGQIGAEALYDPKNLYHNLDTLENHYQETLCPDDLDERFYLYNLRNTAGSKPGNFTPFAKQGSSNKSSHQAHGNSLATPPPLNGSRPYLDYGVSGKMTLDLNLKDIKHSNQTVPASPYGQNLPVATPMTKALEMYNWLNDKVKLKKSESGFPLGLDRCLSIFGRDSKDDILVRLESILGGEKAETSPSATPDLSKHLKDKHSQIVNLYFTILEVVLSKEERKGNTQQITDILKNDNFHRALVAASMETVFFVNNYSSISFVDLLELCGIQAFEFWRIISSFLNFDPKMPQPIKKHFHDLEFQIIMNLAWKKDSVVHQLINKFMDQMKEGESTENIEESDPQNKPKPVILTHPQELFFKRLLHHIANQISQICDLLALEDVMSEHVWTAMKHVIGSEGHLLINRHLNQFILCCVYGVTKVFQHPLKFQEIINKYQDLPRFNKDDFADVVHHVYIDENNEMDLIKFYNSVFITPMKSFLFSLSKNRAQAESRASNTPLIKSLNTPAVMQSPLRDFITNQKGMTPSTKIGLTPQTKALHAFGESPYGVLESINKILGKRPVDFIDSPKVVLSDVGNVLRKYVKHSDAVLDKMFEEDSTKSNSNNNMTSNNIIESVAIEPEKCKPALPSKRNLFGTNANKAAAK